MCYLKVDLNKILKDTDFKLLEFQDSLRKLEPLAKDGLLEVTDSSIQINQNARQITRIVSSIFDKYFTGGLNKHSIVA